MQEFKEKIESTQCTNNFIDANKGKVSIKRILLKVVTNSLTISTPSSTIYTSDEEDVSSEYIEEHGEKKLLKDGEIYKLAETGPIKPNFVGIKEANLESAPKELSDAEFSLVGLNGSVIIVIADPGSKPETKIISGEEFFVVPNGEIKLTFMLVIEITFSYHDAICVLQWFKKSIREEEKSRRSGQ
jgi:hypothetical protein